MCLLIDTAAVFPPAIPGAALMTAFTYVFQTFKDVKHDYDRVSGFFTEMEAFCERNCNNTSRPVV